ncbi:hypothetical protein [Nannocystis pusilla]|uniref:Uncharacterized protein n=1 Tax=Nannocystis pusilla TaxID=889268 RepID=A0ABS7TKH7_9BACT|nr:hypothetical protein [Nannocystis pusilla]MBZ5708699.1 hypothetical protein [Nannocystis pusilla]
MKLILWAPVCAVLSVFAASTAHASGDYPTVPSCPEGTLEYKIDWPVSKSYPIPGTSDYVEVKTDGMYFDWSSKVGMDAVIAEGEWSGEKYAYDPEAYGGKGLHASMDPKTYKPHKLKRIKFCYDLNLKVEKTAETKFKRKWDWKIEKKADPSYIELRRWEKADVSYEIGLDAEKHDKDFAVKGEIKIWNPTKFEAKITAVKDILDGVEVPVDCGGVEFPYTLEPYQKLVCTYWASRPNANTVENKAIVKTHSDSKVGGDTARAEVKFTSPSEEIDKCVTVTDKLDGVAQTLPTDYVCAGETPKTIQYWHTFGPLECSEWDHEFKNIATFKTNDTHTEGHASTTVKIKVKCPNGCTRTQGYWKTHSKHGPAPRDAVWDLLLPNGPDTQFFKSGKSWLDVFKTPPQGNAYYILAHQYMAAVLNDLADADIYQIHELLDLVKSFFEKYGPSEWQAHKDKAVLTGWASTLEKFNSGNLGATHCE